MYCSNTPWNQSSLKRAPVILRSRTSPRYRLSFEWEILGQVWPPEQFTDSLTKDSRGEWHMGIKIHTCFQTSSVIHLLVQAGPHTGLPLLHSSFEHLGNDTQAHPALLNTFSYTSSVWTTLNLPPQSLQRLFSSQIVKAKLSIQAAADPVVRLRWCGWALRVAQWGSCEEVLLGVLLSPSGSATVEGQ